MNAPQELASLGHVRDGLLTAAAFVYIVGYLTWALYALSQGFGPLPLLEPQYFVAGLLPTALFYGMYHFYKSLKEFSRRTSERRIKTGNILLSFAMLPLAVAMALWLFGREQSGEIIAGIGLVSMLVANLLFGAERKDPDGADKPHRLQMPIQSTHVAALALVVLALGCLVFYSWLLFPEMPSEIGGPNGRLITLDLHEEDISPQLRQMLSITDQQPKRPDQPTSGSQKAPGQTKDTEQAPNSAQQKGADQPKANAVVHSGCVYFITSDSQTTLISRQKEYHFLNWARIENNAIAAVAPCTASDADKTKRSS